MVSASAVVLITIAALMIFSLFALIIVLLLGRLGINFWWSAARKGVEARSRPCMVSGDCGRDYQLGPSWICDPKVLQCRLRSYIDGSCTKNDDCLEITSSCRGEATLGFHQMCIHEPYQPATLYGRSTDTLGCGARAGLNTVFNFCQYLLGTPCTATDDCLHGACVGGICSYLQPFAECSVGGSYALNQCGPSDDCVVDPRHKFSSRRCQPRGVVPGSDGSYCQVNSDCNNNDCYKLESDNPIGICASHIGLVGMICDQDSECANGLECHKISSPDGVISGVCAIIDPSIQTDDSHCPLQYTEIASSGLGCAKASRPVPCSEQIFCKRGCSVAQVENLILGMVDPSQLWIQIYPRPNTGGDTYNLFRDSFVLEGDGRTFSLLPNLTILISPFQSQIPAATQYPVLSLEPPLNLLPGFPNEGSPPVEAILDPRSCQSISANPLQLVSSFANAANDTVIFLVKYNPLDWVSSRVTAYVTSTRINSNQPVQIILNNDRLGIYYLSNMNPTADPPIPATEIYVYGNYTCDSGALWVRGNLAPKPTAWGNLPLFVIPLPTLPATTSPNGAYFGNSMRFLRAQDPNERPKEPYANFFYYPIAGEEVMSSKFSTLPTQGGGGVTTLVGTYDVRTTTGRKIVISTLALFTNPITFSQERHPYAYYNSTTRIYAVRNSVHEDTSTGSAVYASVYSFDIADFTDTINWPFTGKIMGPPSTQHDTAGLCRVTFDTNPVPGGVATFTTLEPLANSVPGYRDRYSIFQPHSYTRVQSVSPIRSSQWTGIFEGLMPTLVDSDMIVIGSAGASSIIGILLNLQVGGGDQTKHFTLLLTARFGDAMPTSRYSTTYLSSNQRDVAARTQMFTFYLTPEVEETGGGGPWPTPQDALAPSKSTDITSWITSPTSSGIINGNGVSHTARTPWGSEVFTASFLPSNLRTPVRFFRMPITSTKELAISGNDDVWIWGRDANGDDMICVPLFFDYFGTTFATNKVAGKPTEFWLSTAATVCPPPTPAEVILGMEVIYNKNFPDPSDYQVAQWRLPNAPIINPLLPDPAPVQNPMPLLGRMCETQGYQDGLLLRVRPYAFLDVERTGGLDNTLPTKIFNQILATSAIFLNSIESMAVALATQTAVVDFVAAIPLLGIGGIQAMIGSPTLHYTHPRIVDFFKSEYQEIVWVGSEGGSAPIIPGGYRTVPCPGNPRAIPFGRSGTYPNECADFGLAVLNPTDRKSLPVVIVRNSVVNAGQRETRLYELEMKRTKTGIYTAVVVSDSLLQTNEGLATMSSYPGFNGGPTFVYTPCV